MHGNICDNSIAGQIEALEFEFSDALEVKGFGKHLIPADGEWHDFRMPGQTRGKKSGAAKLTFGRDGVVIDRRKGNAPIFVWQAGESELTAAQRKALAAQNAARAAEMKRRQEAARQEAANTFPNYTDAAANHPYLVSKGITDVVPLKLTSLGGKPWLIVPMFNAVSGELQTLQLISPTGRKMFLRDGVTSGACVMPGRYGLDALNQTNDPVVIAEGYATAEAVLRSTGWPTLAAMNCGNLKPVAEAVRQRFPQRRIILAADHDAAGTGLEAANNAARAVEGQVAMPDKVGTDFSDLLLSDGAEVVAGVIKGSNSQQESNRGDGQEASRNSSKESGHAATPQIDPDVAEVNKRYALVIIGDSTAVMKTDGDDISFLKIEAFKQWHANRHINVGVKSTPLASYWLSHPHRRQYEGVGFWPKSSPPEGYFNLWRGFSVKPIKGNCRRFLHHIYVNVCNRNKLYFKKVIGWFAQLVQFPDEKPGTSLALRGEQGTGKTKVGEVIGSLFPKHYTLVASPQHITGRFNAHLRSTLLLHADEAFWAGDHAAEGKLKDLVTNDWQHIEFKGKDLIHIRNFIRLLITSNSDWIVPAGYGERRFFVIDMGTEHAKDHKYFAAIDEEMDSGGREALLYFLLNVDLSKINLRDIPKTKALLEQQTATMTPEQGWWYDTLSRGLLPAGCEEPRHTPSDHLFEAYLQKANRQGARRRSLQTQFGSFLHKQVPGLSKSKGDYARPDSVIVRGYVYAFPPLKECRAAFAKKLQQDISWEDPEVDWELEEPTNSFTKAAR